MAESQNGWPVNPPRRARLVPGTPDVRVTVADGPAGDVLIHVLAQVHERVEPLTLDGTRGELDDWGYAARPIRGGSETSNHASATATDVNATRHPLGVRGTFTAAQVAEIHRILAEVDHVVRWGGDYSGRVDEMHFEIDDDAAAVARVAARLSKKEDVMNQAQAEQLDYTQRITAENQRRIDRTQAIVTESQRRIDAARAELAALAKLVAAERGIDPAELARAVDESIARHTPTAQQNAAALLPLVQDVAEQVLGADNKDLAAEFLRQLRDALPQEV